VKYFTLHYFNRKWIAVYGYLLIILIATPYLPSLIKWASSRWKPGSISGFVFVVEIFLVALLLFLTGGILFFNRRRFFYFILVIGGLLTFAVLYYLFVPNPYKLTHLPEYAILSMLILQAIKGYRGKKKKNDNEKYLYFQSAAITTALGAIDELYQGALPLRYFAWHDILLDMVGGLLGLTIFWGITRE
jgi:VanZ family protein